MEYLHEARDCLVSVLSHLRKENTCSSKSGLIDTLQEELDDVVYQIEAHYFHND
ncbi:hypothetical protein [Parendozoicomonas haliclonae]|uniref:Uncharacterized protein n=1 Tax=Parendozoicomonas haliclonae TaxID=1960125 RepID=A0A1X7AGV2_9GAMM|nr:hypothetical protein [Parendozoicomonas haliclonae]SMA41448.1 hypothetical protein EHSB41UT_01256 [Parendozoicomonas haliclonae]